MSANAVGMSKDGTQSVREPLDEERSLGDGSVGCVRFLKFAGAMLAGRVFQAHFLQCGALLLLLGFQNVIQSDFAPASPLENFSLSLIVCASHSQLALRKVAVGSQRRLSRA